MRIIRFSPFLIIFLAALTVSPATAAPSLGLGSTASYELNATLTRFDNCTSTNLTIAALACGTTLPIQTGAFVSTNDDGRCSPAPDPACQFSPINVTIIVSGTVSWRNFGSLTHTVTSDTGAFDFTLPRNNFTFTSPQFTFKSAGNFSYHCNFHPWMKGEVDVVQSTPLPATIQSYSLNGPVNWNIVGLDDKAQLEVSNKLTFYNSSATPPERLYNQSSVTGETVELSTRKESSPGLNPLTFLYSLPFPNQGPFQFGPGFGYPYFYPPPEYYTVWWVNGPLKLGSTVEILTVQAAVRGANSVNLGTGLGPHDAWTVSFENRDAFNQTKPSSQFSYYCYNRFPYPYSGIAVFNQGPICYTSGSSNVLSLKLDYGKQSDLLFNVDATIDTYTQTTTLYPAGSFIYGQFYGPGIVVSSPVNVVRTSRSTTSVNLKLASTSLDLSSRTIPPPTTDTGNPTSNTIRSIAALWMYGAVSAFAAGLVGAGVWVVLRARRKNQPVQGFQSPPNAA